MNSSSNAVTPSAASYVLTDKDETFAYEQEWRQRFTGNALAVLRPASTQEVAG
jgi:D-lactate dehydrogenase (cytochrome)